MNKLIIIPERQLIAYCLNLSHPALESVVIRECVDPLCNGDNPSLYRRHFSLFHALYTIKTCPQYFHLMVYIHPMDIVIRNYPTNNACIHYDPWCDAFCNRETVDGIYCSFHYEFYEPYNHNCLYDPLMKFYSDSYNINYEFSVELNKVYRGFKKYIASLKEVGEGFIFLQFNAIDTCNRSLLQKRYRKLVKKYHPDRYNGDMAMIKQINEPLQLVERNRCDINNFYYNS